MDIGAVVQSVLSAKARVRDRDRFVTGSKIELAIKGHVARALKGDIAAASLLLRIRKDAEKQGRAGPLIVTIVNSPDAPRRVSKSGPQERM